MAGLNYVGFNQDHSLLAVATTRGLRVYSTDPFELTNHSYEEDISLVEQLFSTSLVAMILTPRLLRIVNTKRKQKHSTICELTFHGMVVAVKMNRKRLVVLLEEVAFIYDISNMKMLHQQTSPLNPAGICAISPNSENNFLAIPHYQKTAQNPNTQPTHVPKSVTKETISGDVLLYDLNKMEEVTVIQAHQAPLSYIAINNTGTLMATSSEKGTVIRVFSIPSGKKLYQFRRGSMPARIYCMSFNATSTLLCVSSATETVHIFKLAPPGSNPHNNNTSSSTSPPSSPRHGSFSSLHERSESPSQTDLDSSQHHQQTQSLDGDPSALASAPQPRQPGFMSLVRRTSQNVSTSLVSRATGYLPSSVTEMWEPQRDFAWVRVPRSSNGQPVRCVVAMANNVPHVMVATSEGDFYVYMVNLEKGGEGTLVKRFEYVEP
ncbi:Putative WD40/YVTN repeat-like-containing domain superfamily [Septoria linicola]|uniref:WD40/YVTN repeat-like-containing domain superfamily n=1 Tax=Septoria linicola TaxID=215465 RepID=A0A9Q9B4T7_9PEZI|nr:putative WD40/YVTN repeat-like-containing domain superfamily [Septoria linicola]USW57372.1 Putative WD40/YVTN repeat-like-containing domain superfamily [Septoria linicola]